MNIPTLFQVKASCRPGNKPLCEPMAVRLLTHISVTRLQWVNYRPCYLGTSNTSSGLVSLIMRCTYYQLLLRQIYRKTNLVWGLAWCIMCTRRKLNSRITHICVDVLFRMQAFDPKQNIPSCNLTKNKRRVSKRHWTNPHKSLRTITTRRLDVVYLVKCIPLCVHQCVARNNMNA